MDNDEKWEEPLEENGLTLGPEESLQREIEKSKSLKVDRLRLKDEIEQLKAQKEKLKEIALGKKERRKRDKEREKRGITCIPDDEVDKFTKPRTKS